MGVLQCAGAKFIWCFACLCCLEEEEYGWPRIEEANVQRVTALRKRAQEAISQRGAVRLAPPAPAAAIVQGRRYVCVCCFIAVVVVYRYLLKNLRGSLRRVNVER